MAKFYFYKLTVDDGGAPCVKRNLLSLAICKPMIRSTADAEDVVFGFAASSLYADNRLIYIAKIKKNLRKGEYFKAKKYSSRQDCIYWWDGKTYKIREGAKFHGSPNDLIKDLGKSPNFERANVLLSDDFRYFGNALQEHYKKQFPNLAKAIKSLKRGHRVRLPKKLSCELNEFLKETWRKSPKKVNGSPSQEPRCGVSHRGGVCGTVKSC